MASLKVIDKNGKKVGEVKVAEVLARGSANPQLVHDVIIGYQRNSRQGNASTRTRSEITASGRKPWRQKGTGRARAGTVASPLWRGGGVIFGPRPRSFYRPIPKRMRKKALNGVLANKLTSNKVIIVDKIEVDSEKTKDMAAWLKKIGAVRKPLIIKKEITVEDKKTVRNITGAAMVPLSALNAYLLLSHNKMVISKDDFETLQERVL